MFEAFIFPTELSKSLQDTVYIMLVSDLEIWILLFIQNNYYHVYKHSNENISAEFLIYYLIQEMWYNNNVAPTLFPRSRGPPVMAPSVRHHPEAGPGATHHSQILPHLPPWPTQPGNTPAPPTPPALLLLAFNSEQCSHLETGCRMKSMINLVWH